MDDGWSACMVGHRGCVLAVSLNQTRNNREGAFGKLSRTSMSCITSRWNPSVNSSTTTLLPITLHFHSTTFCPPVEESVFLIFILFFTSEGAEPELKKVIFDPRTWPKKTHRNFPIMSRQILPYRHHSADPDTGLYLMYTVRM